MTSFHSGEPIKDFDADTLGRGSFAKAVARAIEAYSGETSIAIGLYGGWGTGKTSLINLIRRELSSQNFLSVDFNPWHYEKQSEIVAQYFKVLATSLRRHHYGRNYKSAADALDVLAAASSVLHSLPVVGGANKVLEFASARLRKKVDEINDLHELKSRVAADLRHSQKKIVVFLDDLDRLNAKEIQLVFQLVKSLADFPNVIYVLAFDKVVALRALKDVQGGAAEGYLEKILPLSFMIPPLAEWQLKERLDGALNNVSRPEELELNEKRRSNLVDILRHHFITLRSIERYENTLAFAYELVREEVDFLDFSALTALQILNLAGFEYLRNNPETVLPTIGEAVSGITQGTSDQARQFLLASSKFELGDLDLLALLFPKIAGTLWQGEFEDDKLADRSARRAYVDRLTFATYFQLAVDPAEVSEADFKYLARADDVDKMREALASFMKGGRLGRLLLRLEGVKLERVFNSEIIENLISTLIVYSDELVSAERGADVSRAALSFVENAIEYLDAARRGDIIQDAVTASEITPLMIRLIDRFELTMQKRSPLVQPNVVGRLREILVDKIRRLATDRSIFEIAYLLPLLERWARYSSLDEVKGYLALRTLTQHEVLKLAAAIIDDPFPGDEVPSLQLEALANFINRDEFLERLNAITRTNIKEVDEFDRSLVARLDQALRRRKDDIDTKQ